MQKQREWNLTQVGGVLLAIGLGVKVLMWLGIMFRHAADIALAVGLVLLILGLVLPRRR
jgi:hypothetical protein